MRVGEANLSDTCVVGVLNRRVNPWPYVSQQIPPDTCCGAPHVDYTGPTPTLAKHRDSLRAAPPSRKGATRYSQHGARRIDIPLRSDNPQTLLRVREIGATEDTALGRMPIDTIVGAQAGLAVDFLPGEGKLFEVTRLAASDTTGRGFLAFSSQTKLVATPMLNAMGTAYSDSVRYHMVYHGPDTDSARAGVWTVFYQRSLPSVRDNVPSVAGLRWEPPIRLSGLTTLSHPLTDAQARTRRYGVDSVQYHEAIGSQTDPTKDCSCGFPSIVVAERAPLTPRVSVVYACEDMWASAEARNQFVHVVENAFDDVAVLNAAALDVNGKSQVVTVKELPHDGGADTLRSLAKHGTPVVGAAADGRRFYAWSAYGMGIGVATKLVGNDWLAGAQSLAQVPMATMVWYYNPADSADTLHIPGGSARQPSLTTWSNVAHGNHDATLVWTEGVANPHVRYTRLTMGPSAALQRYLPPFVEMHYDAGTPPAIPQNRTENIAVVGAPSPTEHAELPVVVRSLQPDSMLLHIRNQGDSLGRTYNYSHETIAWSEWRPAVGRARVRYNHLLDMGGDAGRELHYWYVTTTFSDGASLFHPVIANAVVRMDTLTWMGIVDDTLQTYQDSLRINYGNLSDSALAVNYTVLPVAAYANMRQRALQDQGSYWTGLVHHTPLKTQQITVRRMPGIPAPPVSILHDSYLAGKGAWPHLSLRERDDRPPGLQGVRRTLQTTAALPPELTASAEGFYKPTANDEWPQGMATYRGFVVGDKEVAIRVVVGGLGELAMATDPRHGGYVSEPITLGEATTLRTDVLGDKRDAIAMTIEEDQHPETALPMTLPGVAERAINGEASTEKETTSLLHYLVGGQGRTFRVRVQHSGTQRPVHHEATEMDPPATDDASTLARAALGGANVLDLASGRTVTLSGQAGIVVFPNPSNGRVNVVLAGTAGSMPYIVVDAAGRTMHTGTLQHGHVEAIEGLPMGVYAVRATEYQTSLLHTIKSASFVVVR